LKKGGKANVAFQYKLFKFNPISARFEKFGINGEKSKVKKNETEAWTGWGVDPPLNES
jgi:hypothetical protein